MLKILVVDDAAFIRTVLKNIISAHIEAHLYEATNGKEAIAEYEKHMPDLVFMDVTMPEVDGLEALKVIKVLDPGARIIICSAMGQQPYIIDAIKSGALDYIVKPFKANKIVEVLEKYGKVRDGN